MLDKVVWVWTSGKIALITMIRSQDDAKSSDELASQVRRELESTKLTDSWTIDRITILDEASPKPNLVQAQKSK